MKETVIVRGIIDQELRKSGKVSKFYVIEEIKNRVTPTRLYNKTLTYNQERSDRATNDGLQNLQIGAEKVYRDCMYSSRFKRDYFVDEAGMIYHKTESSSHLRGSAGLVLSLIPCEGITRNDLLQKIKDIFPMEKALQYFEQIRPKPPVSELSDKIEKGYRRLLTRNIAYWKQKAKITANHRFYARIS